MLLQAPEGQEDIAAPFGVVGDLEVQNNQNQILDVLDGGSLTAEAGDGRSVRGERFVSVHQRIVFRMGNRWAEAIPEGSRLLH
jgi:hypothetical protein